MELVPIYSRNKLTCTLIIPAGDTGQVNFISLNSLGKNLDLRIDYLPFTSMSSTPETQHG